MKKIYFTILFIFLLVTSQLMSQENHLSTSELIINSTIRIECSGDKIINGTKEGFTSTGTGFFFEFLIDSLRIPVIVTNYHVIKDSKVGIINFTEQGKNGPIYGNVVNETLQDFENKWIKHPTVDLAILPVSPILEQIIKKTNKIPFIVPYSEDLLPNKKLLSEISAIEEVLMVGYPRGIWDKTNNLPVVRRGITATPIYIDYDGEKKFLLDIPIFAGSSGSPIVLFNQGSYSSRNGGMTIGTRIYLLGINVQSINYGAEGKLILPPNTKTTIETSTQIPINIAIVIKAEELLAFKPILKKMIESNLVSPSL
jgi:hypothetical protein